VSKLNVWNEDLGIDQNSDVAIASTFSSQSFAIDLLTIAFVQSRLCTDKTFDFHDT
jgi:hypothetical protein